MGSVRRVRWCEEDSHYAEAAKLFRDKFGHEPMVYARSPGRVNLIGEHIDYEGYPVLPMAIEKDTIVAIASTTDTTNIELVNVDGRKFPGVQMDVDEGQKVEFSSTGWGSYFLCGYKGVFDYLRENQLDIPKTRYGLRVVVHGRVPTGAGVSSSSAFVCASVLAVMGVYGLDFPPETVAEIARVCEQYVGTLSGGMDQAISLLGERGVAKLISFNPIKAVDVKLPSGYSFVVANSLVVSNKAEGAWARYNYRVVECQLASLLLCVKLGMKLNEALANDMRTLKQVAEHWRAEFEQPLIAVEEKLSEGIGGYSRQELEKALGQGLETLFERKEELDVIANASTYKLYERAKHVYQESQRVLAFKSLCGNSIDPPDVLAWRLGSLMNESHASCALLYECSSPYLERLVTWCRQHGALGSRLTGAGWGGCTVSLIPSDHADAFVKALKTTFYARMDSAVSPKEVEEAVFVSEASEGASIMMKE